MPPGPLQLMLGSRQWTKLSLVAILIAALWHFFSPWQIVLQSRSEVRNAASRTNQGDTAVQQEEHVSTSEHIEVKRDEIERDFGDLERSLMKDAKSVSNRGLRSRDDSIRLIYGIKKQEDWLDLIGSHDSHVSCSKYFDDNTDAI
jgi:hypothetical protein